MKKKKAKKQKQKILSFPKQLQLEQYFASPIWWADEPSFVDKLNKATSIGTFVVKGNGLEVTNPEGYVVVDGKGTARKLVDRLEFSAANFTAAKRWDKGTSKVA